MAAVRRPIVAAAGIVSRDEFLVLDHYPAEGTFATVKRRLEASGGTTGNIATGLARLGAEVRLIAKVGAEDWGPSVLKDLREEGVDTSDALIVEGASDLSIMLVSRQTRERTILWDKGAALGRGDRIDIDRLFSADLTVIDVTDLDLLRFLVDLPAHTYPQARLVGTLTYLADAGALDKLDLAGRFDVVVGNEREYCLLTGASTPAAAFRSVRDRIAGSNLRTAVMTRGARGAVAATESRTVDVDAIPANVVDTTGAGDAFVAGLSYALASRWELRSALRLANAVASRAVGALGAQTALPSLSEALAVAGLDPDDARDPTA